jgi:phosphoribosyl-ATP pyrophosphohydrolase
MIIPSIDLMAGKAVQLRQGKDHVLTAERDPVELAQEFNRYGEVAVIDLDAALGQGDNLELIRRICLVADVRAGGGIRNPERGKALLRAGARQIIIGTAAEPDLLRQFPKDRVLVALDHLKSGEVVDHGWTKGTGESVISRAERLAPYCNGFLVTFVEDEGGLGGLSAEAVQQLQKALPGRLTVAGGVAGTEDALAAAKLGVDVQVGMALYKGLLNLTAATVGLLDWEKSPLLPTVVQDTAGQVLMLAYSSPESLTQALKEGKGIYFSRSRNEIWQKGGTSGHTQRLISARMDCDRDSLLFIVEQQGPACHTEAYSCFGERKFGFSQLFEVLQQRRRNLPEDSFTAKLFQNRHKLLKKIMEEAFEATQSVSREEYVWEIADAMFFLSMLAVDEGIDFSEIEAELGGRHR